MSHLLEIFHTHFAIAIRLLVFCDYCDACDIHFVSEYSNFILNLLDFLKILNGSVTIICIIKLFNFKIPCTEKQIAILHLLLLTYLMKSHLLDLLLYILIKHNCNSFGYSSIHSTIGSRHSKLKFLWLELNKLNRLKQIYFLKIINLF